MVTDGPNGSEGESIMAKPLAALPCLAALLSLCLTTSAKAATGQTPVFYVAAHPDDIQLFIGNQAATDGASTSVRSVWIVATAGNSDKSSNYWKSREAG